MTRHASRFLAAGLALLLTVVTVSGVIAVPPVDTSEHVYDVELA